MNKFTKIGSLIILLVAIVASSAFQSNKIKESILPGIKFFHGTLKEAKVKAKKENKLIFIDCYTTWCGPCKSMAKKTFVNKEVGDYFNKNFICLKMDMEEEEGVNTASIYAIEAYPTYLFIDFKGDVKHRDLGYIDSESFIEVGKMALAKK